MVRCLSPHPGHTHVLDTSRGQGSCHGVLPRLDMSESAVPRACVFAPAGHEEAAEGSSEPVTAPVPVSDAQGVKGAQQGDGGAGTGAGAGAGAGAAGVLSTPADGTGAVAVEEVKVTTAMTRRSAPLTLLTQFPAEFSQLVADMCDERGLDENSRQQLRELLGFDDVLAVISSPTEPLRKRAGFCEVMRCLHVDTAPQVPMPLARSHVTSLGGTIYPAPGASSLSLHMYVERGVCVCVCGQQSGRRAMAMGGKGS